MTSKSGVVIIGGGQAAAQLIGSLRAQAYDGPITLIGDEPLLPYHRPPLSKKYLQGECPTERLFIRKASYYERMNVTLMLGRRVTRIDRDRRHVQLSDGNTVSYRELVLATGGRARGLPGVPDNMAGVYSLRSRADADRLRSAVRPGLRVVLVGGGYVGLETAATLRTLGCLVTVLEAEPRIMARVAAEPISERVLRCHREQGSTIECGRAVRAIHGDDQFEAVETCEGGRIPADALVIGIGMIPNDELARDAGLTCDGGVLVDGHCRTDDPAISAIGDVACRSIDGRRLRLESVDNAMATAQIAAARIAGGMDPAATAPWFWSDQFDQKLQMVGLAPAAAEWVIRDEQDGRRLSCFYLESGRVRAAQCLNAGGDFQVAKRLVASERAVSAAQLADPNVSLRDL